MALRISRFLALVTGIALPCIETWRRWGMLSDWPVWLDDYMGAAMLLYAWYAGRRQISESRPYLMAGWGYTFGMAYLSFIGQMRNVSGADPSGMSQAVVVGFKGFGTGLALACLAMAWRAKVGTPGTKS